MTAIKISSIFPGDEVDVLYPIGPGSQGVMSIGTGHLKEDKTIFGAGGNSVTYQPVK